MNDFEETALNVVGLDDSEEISYCFKEQNLIVRIKNWQWKIIEIVFNDVILFIDWAQERYISELYLKKSGETSLGDFLISQVVKLGDSYLGTQYNLYQFVTAKGEPCMEIGCKNFEFQIYQDELEFKNYKTTNNEDGFE